MVLQQDVALVLLNNAVSNREPEASACSHFLGGKERVKDALLNLAWNARSGVPYAYFHIIRLESASDGNMLLRHIVERVAPLCYGVEKNLFKFNGIADHNKIFSGKLQGIFDFFQGTL